MKKLLCKRIIGLFVFTFIFVIFNILNPIDVSASEACDAAKKNFEEQEEARYPFKTEYDRETGKYKLEYSAAAASNTVFSSRGINPKLKVVAIDILDKNGGRIKEYGESEVSKYISKTTVAPGQTLTIEKNKLGSDTGYGIEVTFLPDGFMDPELSDACGDTAGIVYIKRSMLLEVGKSPGVEQPDPKYNLKPYTYYNSTDCTNYASKYSADSFEYKFCRDRENAINANARVYEFDKDHLTYASKYAKETKSGMIEFKCDYKVTKANVSINSADYYTNKSYVRGTGTFEITAGEYLYHEETGTRSDAAKCKVKCEEVVTAEYGSPIASKAGLCFEYKVKVTSRVNCGMETPPTKPKEAVVCTPWPYCVNSNGRALAQGGPDEDFDACVKSCDGGKYTDKCVNTCYDEVYGTSMKPALSKTTGNEIVYANKVANTEGACVFEYTSAGHVVWRVNGDGTVRNRSTCDSYYHWDGRPGGRLWDGGFSPADTYARYIEYKRGIPASGYLCHDNCYWVINTDGECGDSNYSHYMNHPYVYHLLRTQYGYADQKSWYEKDIEENTKVYNNLIKQCEAYATCNTSTAEFTISVDYTTKNSTEIKSINFPYTSKKDTIKFNNKDSISCTIDNIDSTILSTGATGCYDCNKTTEERFYQTEWSFPGTWIHNKTGEITYDKTKVNNKYWQEQTDKFCLPLNIKNVNERWYNYYYAKVYGTNTKISYNNTEHTNNIVCPDGTKLTNISCNYQNTTFGSSEEKKIDYNINAITRKFGFFEWDLNIKCFYAVNSEFPQLPDDATCTSKCKPDDTDKTTERYRIRTVDLANLFPDSDGNKLSSTDKTGRTPGFNWTKYSSQEIKDPNYKSQPSNYTKWIQAKGYSVYSDEYLDYEINLTKDKINQLKKKDKNYTQWEGEVETDSVNHYISKELRSILGDSKFPQTSALKCNNMKNYRSSECEEFVGEGN
jgi:hypothetical protein